MRTDKGLAGEAIVATLLALAGEAAAQATCTTSGGMAFAMGFESFACGPTTSAEGEDAMAAGYRASAFGDYSTALGSAASAIREGTAVGSFALANSDRTTALGAGAQAVAVDAMAIGALSIAGLNGGTGNLAVGTRASAGSGPDPIGPVLNATAIGNEARADGNAATALGQGAQANFDGSTAIGQGVVSDRANQVKLGHGDNTYTLSGLASSASLAAQTGPIHFVTSDTSGNLAMSAFDVSTLATTASVEGLRSEVGETRTEARQGIAAAIAMSSAAMPSAAGRTSWAANVGHFKGETAFGGSLSHRLDFDNPVAISLGYSYGGGDSHAARFGMMGEF